MSVSQEFCGRGVDHEMWVFFNASFSTLTCCITVQFFLLGCHRVRPSKGAYANFRRNCSTEEGDQEKQHEAVCVGSI